MMKKLSAVVRIGVTVVVAFVQLGCGLMQGTTQRVLVSSSPAGAQLEALSRNGSRTGTAPTELAVSRRRTRVAVVRASKDGYRSACRLLKVQRDHTLMLLDGLPAAVPLLIDLIFGTLPGSYPNDVDIPLQPLPAGHVDVLPPTSAILAAYQGNGTDYCDPTTPLKIAMDIRSKYANRVGKILVSAGDLSRPYDIVGRVDVNAVGNDYFVWNYWRVGNFSNFELRHFQYKEDPATMNEMLAFKGFEKYGDGFDAILNVHYEDMPGNDVSAGGVAVRFANPAQPQASLESRLRELRDALDRELITHDEYDRKRAEVLKGL
jgi:hypothetical protein